jgi:hypothetical protein
VSRVVRPLLRCRQLVCRRPSLGRHETPG